MVTLLRVFIPLLAHMHKRLYYGRQPYRKKTRPQLKQVVEKKKVVGLGALPRLVAWLALLHAPLV